MKRNTQDSPSPAIPDQEQSVQGLRDKLWAELREAEYKAWDSLSRYKFQMFGYWAAIWVHLNRLGEFKQQNPWKEIVKDARLNLSPLAAFAAYTDTDAPDSLPAPPEGQ